MAPGMLGVIKMMEAATEVARPDVIVIRDLAGAGLLRPRGVGASPKRS